MRQRYGMGGYWRRREQRPRMVPLSPEEESELGITEADLVLGEPAAKETDGHSG